MQTDKLERARTRALERALPVLMCSALSQITLHACIHVFRDGLIAVNYAARARGVTRHMRVSEARKLLPELRLVHVQTIGEAARADVKAGQAQGRDQQGLFAKPCAAVERTLPMPSSSPA